ncbi:predicted protein [Plenodomus lingam JN3]|uniref:Predicted protein n=1 Tax=Leptosphaeria maculans (strain JN3 / isolate v23.1.3 / race Av1-4-5-6-7-8) TaxID=985895 RepID=E4ZND8_LEPMJ|nr:predicted protein [Plenodomus lingam JN3]CBX92997.1 predicted protein [Plenodomus lingam JN3]
MGIPDPFISNPINLCESESCIPDQTRFHRSALKPVCEKLTVMQPRVLVLLLDTLATSFSCVMQPLPPSPYPSGDPLLPHHLPTALGVSPNPARVAACYDTCTRSSFPRPAIRNGLGPNVHFFSRVESRAWDFNIPNRIALGCGAYLSQSIIAKTRAGGRPGISCGARQHLWKLHLLVIPLIVLGRSLPNGEHASPSHPLRQTPTKPSVWAVLLQSMMYTGKGRCRLPSSLSCNVGEPWCVQDVGNKLPAPLACHVNIPECLTLATHSRGSTVRALGRSPGSKATPAACRIR